MTCSALSWKAHALAGPALLGGELDSDSQADVTVPTFDAFDKELKASVALDTCLALLAVFASLCRRSTVFGRSRHRWARC